MKARAICAATLTHSYPGDAHRMRSDNPTSFRESNIPCSVAYLRAGAPQFSALATFQTSFHVFSALMLALSTKPATCIKPMLVAIFSPPSF